MEQYGEYILGLDVAAVVSALVIFMFGNLEAESVFMLATVLIFTLGVLALAFTFLYFMQMGNSNWLLVPALVVLGIGAALTFFSWFVGGLVALAALLMLLLAKEFDQLGKKGLLLSYSGFAVLAIMPPLSALLGLQFGIADELLIIIGLALIAVGIFLALKSKKYTTTLSLGFILLSLSFMFIAPAHELLNIHANGSYGMYDISIITTSTLTFFIYLGNLMYSREGESKLVKDLETGFKLLEQGKYADAIPHFRNALQLLPDDERVLNGLAIALMKLGKYTEAEEHLRKLNRLYPDNSVYMTNMGNLYFRTGRIDKAIEQYNKVLKKDPNYYNALNNLARCYMEKGDYEKARKLLEKAIKIDEDKRAAKVNYYFLLVALGMGNEANKYKAQLGGLVE